MKKVLQIIAFLILGILWFGLASYLPVRYFHRPEASAFKGDSIYNPYQDLSKKRIFRANFHAHTRKWGGMTFGDVTEKELLSLYRSLGYDIIGISDYMHINNSLRDSMGFIPVYEHGTNFSKTHQILIGASAPVWSDQPFYQGFHQKQHNLQTLRKNSALIALAHPGWSGGYKARELKSLAGFDLVEILNQGKRYDEQWDAVLSSGYPAFAVGNDDFHLMQSRDYGRALNLIYADSLQQTDIVEALRSGRNLVVKMPHKDTMCLRTKQKLFSDIPVLHSFTLDSNVIRIAFDRKMKRVRFIRQGGEIASMGKDTAIAVYPMQCTDQYIRISAQFENGTEILFNPLYRYDIEPFTARQAIVDPWKTAAIRMIILIVLSFPLLILIKRRAHFRRPSFPLWTQIFPKPQHG
jgi:hypothetical protein